MPLFEHVQLPISVSSYNDLLVLYCFWDISVLKNIVTLKFRLRDSHPANLCTVCTSLKSTRAYIFATDSMHLSSFTSTCWAPEKSGSLYITVIQGLSVIETGANWKPVCEFLLLFHYNCIYLLSFAFVDSLVWNMVPVVSCHTTTSSQHARPSGVLHRRSDGLECAAWRPTRPVAQCRQFPEEAEDASVSECTWTLSALEALRNALYKFKTYLLTYLSRIWKLCLKN